MSLVYSKTDSGLHVARDIQPGDVRAIARDLQHYDRDLVLVPQDTGYGVAYKVYRHAGSERPLEFICFWGDEQTGEPWPLSSALLDRVRELDKNSGSGYLNADQREAQRKAAQEKEAVELEETIVREHVARAKRGRTASIWFNKAIPE